jgi:hypothetical protein
MGAATRILAAVSTVGGSELLRDKPFQPGGKNPTLINSVIPALLVNDKLKGSASSADAVDPAKPGQTDAERERDARLAADRRRKDYQNLGRSSTILTGPGGLAGSGSGTAKTLLGG